MEYSLGKPLEAKLLKEYGDNAVTCVTQRACNNDNRYIPTVVWHFVCILKNMNASSALNANKQKVKPPKKLIDLPTSLL